MHGALLRKGGDPPVLTCLYKKMKAGGVNSLETLCMEPCSGREGIPSSSHAYTRKEEAGGVSSLEMLCAWGPAQ